MTINLPMVEVQGGADLQPKTSHLAWLNSVASIYLQGQQYARARPLLELLTILCPESPSPLKQLAYLHYRQAGYSDAIHYCQQYAQNQHSNPDPRLHLLRSICHLKRGEKALAADFFEKSVALRTQR